MLKCCIGLFIAVTVIVTSGEDHDAQNQNTGNPTAYSFMSDLIKSSSGDHNDPMSLASNSRLKTEDLINNNSNNQSINDTIGNNNVSKINGTTLTKETSETLDIHSTNMNVRSGKRSEPFTAVNSWNLSYNGDDLSNNGDGVSNNYLHAPDDDNSFAITDIEPVRLFIVERDRTLLLGNDSLDMDDSQSVCNQSIADQSQPGDFGPRSVELMKQLGNPSAAVIFQCDAGMEDHALIRLWGSFGISVCQFRSIITLTAEVMKEPYKGHCFRNRHWTILLMGTPTWAAEMIMMARRLPLHDFKIHWVVMVLRGSEIVSPTLPTYLITHRITWLRWSSRLKGWIVLVSEATSKGLAAREAGRWGKLRGQQVDSLESEKKSSSFQVTRQFCPPYTKNFFQKHVRVISRRDTDPSLVVNAIGRCYNRNDGGTSCTGYVGEMLETITDSLNLSISNSMVISCGMAKEEGTRVTIIANDEADIALGTCSITADRVQVVDFTEFFIAIRSTIASAEPDVMQSPFLIFSVFVWHTWVAILLYILIASFSFWIVGLILSSCEALSRRSLTASFVVISKALVYQAHRQQPNTVTGRALMAFVWVVTITLAGVYSGNLTAWLSIPRYEQSIDSLEDLAKRPNIIPVVNRYDPNHQMFMNRSDGLLGLISKRLEYYENGFTSDMEFIREIANGKYAFMNSDRALLNRATKLNEEEGHSGYAPCRIHIATGDVRQDYLGLIINKNSWLKEQVNERIQWLRSYGIVTYLYHQFNPPGCRKLTSKDRRSVSKSLSFQQWQGVLWVWLVGMSLATLVFLLEKIVALLKA